MIDRLPPHSLEAEQSVLGAILIDRETIIEIAEFLQPQDFYRQAHGSIYKAMLELFERREPVDVVTVAESLERAEDLEQIGGRSLPLAALEPDADRGPRRPVRADRRAQGGPPEPHRRGGQDRGHRLRGPGRDPGGDRPGRVGAVPGLEPADHGRLRPAQGAPPLRLRPARLPPRPPGRAERDLVGLPRHGSAHDGLPEERPDRRRRPPERRQDELRAEHRGARRGPREEDGRRVQPRDEQGAARAAPAVERREHRLEAAPLGLPRGARLRPDRAGDERPLGGARCTSTTRRTSRRWSSGRRPAASRPSPAWTS